LLRFINKSTTAFREEHDGGGEIGKEGWYVHNVSIIFDGFILILCFWQLFLYKVYDLFGLTY
jgi:hypothetical protein